MSGGASGGGGGGAGGGGALPAAFLTEVEDILDAVQPFGRSLEHLIQATRLSREWRNKRTADANQVFDEYFQKVFWSKSEASIRFRSDFHYTFGESEAAALVEGDVRTQIVNFQTGQTRSLRNQAQTAASAKSETAADPKKKEEDSCNAGGGGASSAKEDLVRAVPVQMGCAMETTLSMAFKESSTPSAVAIENTPSKQRAREQEKTLDENPKSTTFGMAKTPACGPDDIVQRIGGWDGAFQGVNIFDSTSSIVPLYEGDALADEAQANGNGDDNGGGSKPVADSPTETSAPKATSAEEKAAAEEFAAAAEAARRENTNSDRDSHGKRAGTKYENKTEFPAAPVLPFPLSVVCTPNSRDATPNARSNMAFMKHLIRFALCAASEHNITDLKDLLRKRIPAMVGVASNLYSWDDIDVRHSRITYTGDDGVSPGLGSGRRVRFRLPFNWEVMETKYLYLGETITDFHEMTFELRHPVLSEQGKPHHCLAGYLTDDFLEFEAYLTVTKNGQFEFLWRDSEKAAESRKAKSKASAKKHRHKQPKLMTEKKKKQRAEQDRTRMQMSDDEDDEEGEMDWEVSTIRGVLTAIRDAERRAIARRMSGYLKTVRAGLSWGYGKLFGKGSEPPESGAGGENTSEVPEKELGPVAAPASNAILLHFDYVRSPVPRVQIDLRFELIDEARMCEISVDSLHNAWLDSGFIRFIARPFVDLKKFKQSLLQTFSVRLGVGAGPGQNLYFQDSTKHPSAAALLATDSFASFRRCTDWHLEFQLTIPVISSFMEMMMKQAAKNRQAKKPNARRGRIAKRNENDEWMKQDGLTLELIEAFYQDMVHRR